MMVTEDEHRQLGVSSNTLGTRWTERRLYTLREMVILRKVRRVGVIESRRQQTLITCTTETQKS